MGDPYTSVTVNNYNDNPPSDDNAQVPANQLAWSKHTEKLGDPLKTAIEAIDTNVGAAFDKTAGGINAAATDYTILAGDQGKTIVASASASTITTADATVVTSPFICSVVNQTASVLTIDGSGAQTIDGFASVTLPVGAGVTLDTDGTNWFTRGRGNTDGSISYAVPLPRNYLTDLEVTTNVTDPQHDADIATGECRDFANSANFSLDSTLTKRIDASWVTGNNNGGRASAVSLVADTWYHLYLVDDGAGTIDAGWDTSTTAANILSDTGGTLYRRIRSHKTDGSANIRKDFQFGDRIWWDVPENNLTLNPGTGSALTFEADTPLGFRVMAGLSIWSANQAGLWYHPADITDTAADINTPLATLAITSSGSINTSLGITIETLTDTASLVTYRAVISEVQRASTLYYIDRRGRDSQ